MVFLAIFYLTAFVALIFAIVAIRVVLLTLRVIVFTLEAVFGRESEPEWNSPVY
jgi:hypothetical protein